MNKYWQQCEIPGCTNEVTKAKAICDDHTPGGSANADGPDGSVDGDAE